MYLLEKRSDNKTPIQIKLSSSKVILGSRNIKALKNYKNVSKVHASLTNVNGSWYIKDLKSLHGVFLNFEKLGKDPSKVEHWTVIGLGGNFISDDTFTCVLCPYGKDVSKNTVTKSTGTYSKSKPSSKRSFLEISGDDTCASSGCSLSTTVKLEEGGTHSYATSDCDIPAEFKPDLLIEKRSDGKTPTNIQLFPPNFTLGSSYIKAFKNYAKISKLHACLFYKNGSWYIKDLGSAHGVFLNFEKIGKDPIKVDYWNVIGLGGGSFSDDVFTCVLCPYEKHLAENAISKHIVNSEISEEGGTNSYATDECKIPAEFKPALLIEKRSDSKTPTIIKLSSPNVTLGSGNIKALKHYTKISKFHASLTYNNGSWYIGDFGSAHGVFLNFGKIGKDPIKVEYWNVIGLGGSCISDDVFTCVLCPDDKDLTKNAIKNLKNHSKGELSSKTNLSSDATEKNCANSCLTNICSVRLERSDSDSILSRNSKYPMGPKESKRNSYSSQDTRLSNSFDVNNKVESYLRSIKISPGENDNLYAEGEAIVERSHDDDAKSTSSSIESMNIIMYPSASVLSKIQKSQKCAKKSANLKNKKVTSSIHSADLSESLFCESSNSKKKAKISSAADSVQKNSDAKFTKKTEKTFKNKLELRSFFKK